RPARVEILRNGAHRTLSVQLAERPSEQQLASANPRGGGDEDSDQGSNSGAPGALGLAVRPASAEDRSRLGLNANEGGLLITAVDPSSDLADKGVRAGDVILQAGGHAVRTVAEFNSAAETARHANRPLLMQVGTRGGRRFVAASTSSGAG